MSKKNRNFAAQFAIEVEYDYLIVGSGLYGATFAYFATQAGKRCLVIDKRPQLGGNLYGEDFALDFTPLFAQ